MKCLERNKVPFYYCLQAKDENGKPRYVVQEDEWGNQTGENTPMYEEAKPLRANISWATGRADTEQFGVSLDYDRVIVMDKFTAPLDEDGRSLITETTVLFVDKDPEYDDNGQPLYDYIVKRVSPSIHIVSIAIKKVEVC